MSIFIWAYTYTYKSVLLVERYSTLHEYVTVNIIHM